MSKFVPIYEYCKKHNVSKQNVYRWIRERKIPETDIKKELVSVERLRINENSLPK